MSLADVFLLPLHNQKEYLRPPHGTLTDASAGQNDKYHPLIELVENIECESSKHVLIAFT